MLWWLILGIFIVTLCIDYFLVGSFWGFEKFLEFEILEHFYKFEKPEPKLFSHRTRSNILPNQLDKLLDNRHNFFLVVDGQLIHQVI